MFKTSDTPQSILIFHYSPHTGEYIKQTHYHVPPHTGLPVNCTYIHPPNVERGHSIIFQKGKWEEVENNINKEYYDTLTGAAIVIKSLGPPPINSTQIKPTSIFDEWDGTSWIKNIEKENSHFIFKKNENRNILIDKATEVIDILTDINSTPDVTLAEKKSLEEWKTYRLSLYRLELNSQSDIEWPIQPEK